MSLANSNQKSVGTIGPSHHDTTDSASERGKEKADGVEIMPVDMSEF